MEQDNGERERLYNIRIIRSYVEYIDKFYQDIDIDLIFEHAGLERSELADDGHWCSQSQVDRFQDKVVVLTKNPHAAREAGRYTLFTRAYQQVRQYLFGFISPATAYLLLPSIAAKLSRGAAISARSLGTGRVEVISKPTAGVREKEHQCQNRIGHIEALAAAFTGKYAAVEHPSCIHKGSGECRYLVSWTEPLFLKVRRVRNYLLAIGFLGCGILSFFLSPSFTTPLVSMLILLITGCTVAGWYLEKGEYRKQLDTQSLTAEQLMHEADTRTSDALMIREIGQTISSMLDIDTLLQTVMHTLKNFLDFDRGAVLLANREKTRLQYQAGYGFSPDLEDLFKSSDILLDDAGAGSPFGDAFREMRPILVNGMGRNGKSPAWQDGNGLLLSGAGSCICIPLIFEKQSLGILYVSRKDPSSQLRQSDLDRLMVITPQISISMHNARTFEQMETSEARYRSILEDIEEAYYEVDLQGKFTFFNPTIEKTFGYTEDELNGLSYKEYMDEENIEKVFKAFHQVYLTGEPIKGFEWKLRDRNGKELHVEASVSLRRDSLGNPTGFKGITREITERRKSEEALRESRQMLQLILDTIPVRVFWKDLSSSYLGGNRRFIQDTELGSADELRGRDDFSMPWAEHAALYREYDRAVIESGEPKLNYVQPETRSDGTTAWLETSKLALHDARGVITGLLGLYEDITVKRKSEDALRESEARFRLLAENANDIIFTMGADLRFTYISPSVKRVRGFTVEEAMNQSPGDALTPESLERAMTAFTEELEIEAGETKELHRTRTLELEERCKDGSTIWTESTFTPLRDENDLFTGFLGITRDISQRKKAEAALKKSEERYRLLAENARDVIWVMDLDLRHTFVSPSVQLLRGFTVEEVLGQSIEQMLTPESARRLIELYRREMALEKGGQKHGPGWSHTTDVEMTCKDGSTVWVEMTMNMLYDEGDDLTGFMGISRDITEWKKSEEDKKHLERRLIQAQKMESIGTLAGGIAHDFNNLLTGILGNVSLVLMKMDDRDPLLERLKNIEEYVQRGSDLTKQLLGFARGGKYEVKPTDLGDFIRKSADMFGRTKKEIRIECKIQQGLWAVEVDRGQMEQVLLNLYVNAWQAMPNGGELFLSAENAEPGNEETSPYGVSPGRFVKVVVTDTGIGMDEATRVRIFEPFFTTKERGRGTGLGLASVYGIVKNHGGFITVESQKGVGTSFRIHLPASDKEIEVLDKPPDEIRKGNETVLLVDDEDMILDIGSRMLEDLGYSVVTATGGRQGLQVYEKDRDRISLVILDMIMPDCSGKETFDTLRTINPEVRVLLSSGYSLDGQAKNIMDSGCRGFIQKPFTMVELSKKVRGILDD
jgi:two-component system, cell cycle sensor histidine kinase and response regulator CckA